MKKGFTLIELLAVIVILAIILLIAMPILLNVISEARKGAFESSVMGLRKTAEQEYMRMAISEELKTNVVYYWSDGQQVVYPNNPKYPPLEYSGKGPENGYIKVYPDGSIEIRLTDDSWYMHEDAEEIDLGSAIPYDEFIEELLEGEMFEEIVDNIIEAAKEELERKKSVGIDDEATYNLDNDLEIIVVTGPEANPDDHPPLVVFPPNSPLISWFPEEGTIVMNPSSQGGPEIEGEFVKGPLTYIYADGVVIGVDPCDGETSATIGGQLYPLTAIGNQCWLAVNLNYQTHSSGTSWCYEEKPENCNNYGRLYTYDAATSLNIAGFKVPSDEDWQELESYLGMSNPDSLRWRDSGNVGQKLKVKPFAGINLVGFNAHPGGWRYDDAMEGGSGSMWPWWDLGYTGRSTANFWTATSSDENYAWGRSLSLEKSGIHRWANYKEFGYSVRLLRDSAENVFNANKGVNEPQLMQGMNPIKWSGSEWVQTLFDDNEWYDYQNQKWANAKTADGSYWVWIPRFAYQIESGYHTNIEGNINIKFLQNFSNKGVDGIIVENEPSYSGSSQENYIVHPAFSDNESELTGFWVAKFMASNSAHVNYDHNERMTGVIPYTHLVEGKEYFLGHSSWQGGYYIGVVEPLGENYNCNFYLNKRNTTSTNTYNRAYVTCDVPYKYTHITNSNYANNEPIIEAPGWYYLYGNYKNIMAAGSLSTIVSHTNTTMYFSNIHATSNAYWTEYNTTNPSEDLAMNANVSIYNDNNEGYIKSVPNASAWRGMTVKNTFDKVQAMKTNAIYGWDSNSNFNLNLMKNSQWGAIAYLAHSSNGKNDAVWSNPSNQYITGCAGSGVNAPSTSACPNVYDSNNGMQASTTGNVYGIYDMSGGAHEVVMANFNNINLLGGFADLTNVNDRYIDRYDQYNSSFYGDAIYETSSLGTSNNSWYGNTSWFMNNDNPWLWRGGSHNSGNAGMFSFQHQTGGGQISNYSFRPVIVFD